MNRLFTSAFSVLIVVLASMVAAGCGGTSEKELQKSEARTKAQEKALNPEAAAEEEAAKEAEAEKTDEKPADKTDEKPADKTGEKPKEEPKKEAEEKVDGDAENGKGLFVTSCGGCHALADAGTSGAVGPKIDGLGWDFEKVLAQIKNGKNAMPPNTATGDDANDIAAYVAEAAK